MHSDQHEIAPEQAAALVRDELPDLAALPVVRVAGSGTVNAIFRVGDAVAARFPLLGSDPDAVRRDLEREAEAAAEFAECSPFPVPRQLHIGSPGHGYPLPWSAQAWLPGTTATPTGEAGSFDLAHDLARLIRALRDWDTRGRRFPGDGRGGGLRDHEAWVAECLDRSEGLVDVPALRRLWATFRDLQREDPDVMSHTDLIPGNLLVADGRLAGVLDAGGFRAADPALDLVCAWHLLDAGPRQALRDDLGCGDLEWARGQAWAFEQAMGVVWYYRRTNPPMAEMGVTTLTRLLTEAG